MTLLIERPATASVPSTGLKLSVIGCGYLGAVHAASMASLGHDVVGIDVDQAKIAALAAGNSPFFEDQLPELIAAGTKAGNLRFSTDTAAVAGARIHFLAVGTPQTAGSDAADLTYLNAAVDALLPHLGPDHLVVGKSTVPVGTAQVLVERIEATGAQLVWNPEFLRESFAVQDTLRPDRLVYGVRDELSHAVDMLDAVYADALSVGTPRIITDYATSELVKVAANAFLATKISFINAMAEIAEVAGADVTQLADAIGHDARIGRKFLNAGVGFGGGCLPKDIRAFAARAEEMGTGKSVAFLREVDTINIRQRHRVIDKVREAVGNLDGAKIAILGLAFKPNSDDVRDSPALFIARELTRLGATVTATDPEAIDNSRRILPDLRFSTDVPFTVAGADAVIVMTEWSKYRNLDPFHTAELVARANIIDARNCLNQDEWTAAGWNYTGMGR